MPLRFAWLFVLSSLALFGQGSVTIFGTITDESGAAVPQATVVATNQSTGVTRQTVSGADGAYILSQLPIGIYSVAAEAAGFKKFVQNQIEVAVDENRRVDVRLQLGAVSERVEVTAEAVQVETRSGTLREVIDSERITELPLNGRNALELQYLVAGAGGTVTAGQEQNDSVSINGSRPNTNNYALDGADNHDPYFNTPSVFPNPDALAEFSLSTNAFSADRGRNAGALMNAVTRSGTNRIHGTAFEFLRNEIFNARNFFSINTPPFKRHQFGGTLGGPIKRDKTFYFASYQRTRERSSPTPLTPTVLTEAERGGNFSATRTAIRDPLGGTFAGNIIPASRISPISRKFLETVPLPNGVAGLYTFASNQAINDNQLVTKIDHVLSESNRLSGRFLYNNNDSKQSVNNTTLPGYLALIQYRNYNLAITDTYLISPRLVNTFTFGYNNIRRDQVPITPAGQGWTEWGAGFVRAAPDDPLVGFDTTVSGYFHPQSRYPLHHYRKSYQFTEGLNWTRGAHFLRFGGDIRRNVLSLQENFQTDAAITINATNTGNAATDLLLGYLGNFTQIAPDSNRPRNNEIGLYVQDDWKPFKRLTLNLGLRWDPFLPYSDVDGRFGQVRFGQKSTRFPNAPAGMVYSFDPDVPNATMPNQFADFSPRFGFAWDPFGKGRTSVRGGYGLFYSQARQQANNQVSNDQPFSIKLTGTNPKGGLANPYSDTGNPFPFHAPATPQEIAAYKFILPLNVTQWNPDFRNARSQQWNLTLQHQLWSTWLLQGAYVGAKSNHLFMSTELNPAVYGAAGSTVDARRRYYPNFSTITDMNSAANSTYHALQLTLNKRMSKGLTILSSYTWSKSLDNASGDDAKPANPYRSSADKGPSNNDIPHRFVASFIYQTPALRRHGAFLRNVVGGWTINGIGALQTSTPLNIVSGRDNSGTGIGNDRADVIGDWYVDNSSRSKNDWIAKFFNTAAFGPNKVGTFGNAGRNILRGPMRQTLDMGLLKTFRVAERYRLQFRAETFNVLNHANFGNPNGNQSAANFGRITTASTPRIMQMALKVIF